MKSERKVFGSFSFAVKAKGGTGVESADGTNTDVRSSATFIGANWGFSYESVTDRTKWMSNNK